MSTSMANYLARLKIITLRKKFNHKIKYSIISPN